MARWGRKRISWFVNQWLDGYAQLPKKTGSNWRMRGWLEQTSASTKKQKPMYGSFKAKKRGFALRSSSFSKRSLSQEESKYNASNTTGRFTKTSSSGRQSRSSFTWKSKLLIFFMLGVLVLTAAFVYMEKNLREPLMHVAKIRIKQLATHAINGAVAEQVATRVASESLIDWKMDSGGKVSGFMLNYNEHMRITASTIATVQGTLKNLQHVPERIPLGHALDSAIISNYGPKIPISFEPLGAVKVELNTREKNAAINMVLVEVYIKVITEIAIIIPFDMKAELVETEIPISYLLVVGDVPMYYYDSSGRPIGESAHQAPNIAVPLEPGQGISSGGSTDGTASGVTEGTAQQEAEVRIKEGEKKSEGLFISP